MSGSETGALEQASHQDTKPTLDLIEPRSMFWDVDKANPMVGVGQESGAGFHRLEDATLVFDS